MMQCNVWTILCIALGYSWIAYQLEVGTTLAFMLLRSDFKSVTSVWLLNPNCTGYVAWFFVKPQNRLFAFFVSVFNLVSNSGFQGVLDTISALWAQNRYFSESEVRYEQKELVRDYRFSITPQEIDVYLLKYRWYKQARYYRLHAHQLDFLR